jgi:hypothetical protein
MKFILFSAALLLSTHAFAQTTAWNVSGYVEAYYSYDMDKPVNNTKSSFLYSYNRNNEVNLNLAFIKVNYANELIRANVAIATGTYMNANYAAEPGLLKNIYEANVGVKLSKQHNLWVDAGVLPSHIGWEGANGKDYPTLTRSIAAENSPYFETGVKIGYTSKSEKWYLSAMVLNGWQRIQRADGNTTPAFGTQITFKPTAKVTLNSSTFIGNDKPDSVKQMRYFHDLYGSFQLSNSFSLIAGFDIGTEDNSVWYTPTLMARYAPGKLSVSARAEYFKDEDGVIISTGFNKPGYSANVDYKIGDHALWRFEVRQANSLFLTTALAIGF